MKYLTSVTFLLVILAANASIKNLPKKESLAKVKVTENAQIEFLKVGDQIIINAVSPLEEMNLVEDLLKEAENEEDAVEIYKKITDNAKVPTKLKEGNERVNKEMRQKKNDDDDVPPPPLETEEVEVEEFHDFDVDQYMRNFWLTEICTRNMLLRDQCQCFVNVSGDQSVSYRTQGLSTAVATDQGAGVGLQLQQWMLFNNQWQWVTLLTEYTPPYYWQIMYALGYTTETLKYYNARTHTSATDTYYWWVGCSWWNAAIGYIDATETCTNRNF